jgi:RNA polymerase sigma-70 factor (ECF subfamily)
VDDDDDLVREAKTGDPDAWRELYRAHAGRLVTWLSTRQSDDAALSAEDLGAEAWLVAAQKIQAFHGTSSQFAGWLFGIARNLTANTRRRSARRRTDPTLLEGPLELPAPSTSDAEGDAWVRAALACLPPRERDVVGCIDGLGLDVEATARALGMSAVAVRVARHRGLRKLRKKYPSPDQPDDPGPSSASRRSRTAGSGATARPASRS